MQASCLATVNFSLFTCRFFQCVSHFHKQNFKCWNSCPCDVVDYLSIPRWACWVCWRCTIPRPFSYCLIPLWPDFGEVVCVVVCEWWLHLAFHRCVCQDYTSFKRFLIALALANWQHLLAFLVSLGLETELPKIRRWMDVWCLGREPKSGVTETLPN